MNRTDELRKLIEIFNEENRNIMGNCSSIFHHHSDEHEVLHGAFKWAHIIRQKALHEIEKVFFRTVYWEDNDDIVKENARNYAWSLLCPFRHLDLEKRLTCTRQAQKNCLHNWLECFSKSPALPDRASLSNERVAQVSEWLWQAFEQEIAEVQFEQLILDN